MSEKCRHCRQTGIIQRWQGFQRLQGVFFCRQKCRQNVYRKRLSSAGKALSVYILETCLYTDKQMRYGWEIKTISCIQTCGFELLKPYCCLPIVQYTQKTILYQSCMDLEQINKNLDFLTLFFVQYFKFGKRLTNRKIADTIIPENKILLCFPHRKFRQTEITSIFNFQIYEC